MNSRNWPLLRLQPEKVKVMTRKTGTTSTIVLAALLAHRLRPDAACSAWSGATRHVYGTRNT